VYVTGGTVDITVHEVVAKRKLKELHWANGGAWGGTCVDKAFENFLRKLVDSDSKLFFKYKILFSMLLKYSHDFPF